MKCHQTSDVGHCFFGRLFLCRSPAYECIALFVPDQLSHLEGFFVFAVTLGDLPQTHAESHRLQVSTPYDTTSSVLPSFLLPPGTLQSMFSQSSVCAWGGGGDPVVLRGALRPSRSPQINRCARNWRLSGGPSVPSLALCPWHPCSGGWCLRLCVDTCVRQRQTRGPCSVRHPMIRRSTASAKHAKAPYKKHPFMAATHCNSTDSRRNATRHLWTTAAHGVWAWQCAKQRCDHAASLGNALHPPRPPYAPSEALMAKPPSEAFPPGPPKRRDCLNGGGPTMRRGEYRSQVDT